MNFFLHKKFYLATATLIGTIIGAGMFGIPYAFSKSGVLIGLFFLLILGSLVTILHLAYGEVIARTQGQHRLIGYAEKYLGSKGKALAVFSTLFGFNGGLLVYILLGGKFLYELLFPWFGGTPFFYSIVFFIVGAIGIFCGLKLVSRGEFFLTFFLILALTFILVRLGSSFFWENLEVGSVENFFLPYGVVLFALGGASAIPEMSVVLSARRKFLPVAIVVGTLIPAFLYALFAFMVVGVTGGATSEEAILGLRSIVGDGVVTLGALIGFLAVITSFLVIGLNLKETYRYDYHIPHGFSWALALFVPFFLFLAGVGNFITTISIIGALGSAIDGIIIFSSYWKAKKNGDRKPEFSLSIPRLLSFSILFIFVLGAIYEIFFQL